MLRSPYLEQLRRKTSVVPSKPLVICGSVGTCCIFLHLLAVGKKPQMCFNADFFFFKFVNPLIVLFFILKNPWSHLSYCVVGLMVLFL